MRVLTNDFEHRVFSVANLVNDALRVQYGSLVWFQA